MATLERAIAIAAAAHADQVDKAGAPYILHPLRVMLSCKTIDERIVAVLHDVVEDTGVTVVALSDQAVMRKGNAAQPKPCRATPLNARPRSTRLHCPRQVRLMRQRETSASGTRRRIERPSVPSRFYRRNATPMSTVPERNRPKVVPIRPPVTAGEQLPLLPLRADIVLPAPPGSADLKQLIKAVDGHCYAAKRIADHPMLPASEFVCYRLATACGLPVPYAATIAMPDGELVFGSRLEGGATDRARMGPTVAMEAMTECSNTISAIFAFDLFVGNEDRHQGNFLYRKNQLGEWAPLAIDYSRALLVNNFPEDGFPLKENTNTRLSIEVMKKLNIWRAPFAVNSVDRMRDVTREHLAHYLAEMPREWLSPNARANLLGWWQTESFLARLNAVFKLL